LRALRLLPSTGTSPSRYRDLFCCPACDERLPVSRTLIQRTILASAFECGRPHERGHIRTKELWTKLSSGGWARQLIRCCKLRRSTFHSIMRIFLVSHPSSLRKCSALKRSMSLPLERINHHLRMSDAHFSARNQVIKGLVSTDRDIAFFFMAHEAIAVRNLLLKHFVKDCNAVFHARTIAELPRSRPALPSLSRPKSTGDKRASVPMKITPQPARSTKRPGCRRPMTVSSTSVRQPHGQISDKGLTPDASRE